MPLGKTEDKTYLPLGTTVRLGEGEDEVKLVIYARAQQLFDESGGSDGLEYDYAGVLYPLGYLDEESVVLFNQDAIDEVVHLGYADAEDAEFVREVLLSDDED